MFVVTDVTGHVGRAVLAELANQPVAVRALLPESGDLPIKAPNIEAVRADSADPSSLPRAFEGAEAAFLASGYSPHIAEAHLKLANAAREAGVKRFVQLSGVGANPQMCCARMLRWFGQAENGVAALPDVQLTRLRPTYMLQLLFEFAPTIAQQGLIAGPFRSTQWSWVDARDVAAVAVAALKDPSHAGRIYTVTGSESLSFPQIADKLSHILGRPVRYQDITANEARGWLQGKGLSPVMIEAKLEYWDACASKMLNVAPNSVVQEVTGRAPRTLEEFVQDYKARFLSASAA
jgi:uncharacterized protein YbjT (DUF2867 family)